MERKEVKQLKELDKIARKKLGERKELRLAAEQWDKPWKTLIATILSARSLDETTIKYSTILFKKYPNVKALANAKLKDMEKIIKPINFYKNKSRMIINCAKQLVDNYNGKPPLYFEKLIELPGVGRKTANVFLSEQGHDTIGIDTHVNFISHYLGWSKHKKSEYIEQDLKKIFPKAYWSRINPTLVRFGKMHTSRKEKRKVLDEVKRVR
ncbi:endonuclease III [Candidatus Pacearchaeota archaeon]|nr:endonuclease III [Candidatus Pacearchaeota archaeon]